MNSSGNCDQTTEMISVFICPDRGNLVQIRVGVTLSRVQGNITDLFGLDWKTDLLDFLWKSKELLLHYIL